MAPGQLASCHHVMTGLASCEARLYTCALPLCVIGRRPDAPMIPAAYRQEFGHEAFSVHPGLASH